jgi:hypothetical protein
MNIENLTRRFEYGSVTQGTVLGATHLRALAHQLAEAAVANNPNVELVYVHDSMARRHDPNRWFWTLGDFKWVSAAVRI